MQFFLNSFVNDIGLVLFKDFIFREGKGGRKEERNITVWLPVVCHLLGTWPITQVCALTGNRTSSSLVQRLALSPLSHTSQDLVCKLSFGRLYAWVELPPN